MKAEVTKAGRNAICPYYIRKCCGVLSCEAILPSAVMCNMLFEGEEIETHFTRYCSTFRWEKCPHAVALSEIKYKEGKERK